MVAIEAQQHRLRTSDLDLGAQDGLLLGFEVVGGRRLEAAQQVLGELVESQRRLGASPLEVQQTADRHPIDPGAEAGSPLEGPEVGDDADQYLLGRILGVGGVPQHANRHAVHIVLDASDEPVEGGRVAVDGARDQGLQGWGLHLQDWTRATTLV